MRKVLILSGVNWSSTLQRHHRISYALLKNGYEVDFVEGVKSSSVSFDKLIDIIKRKLKERYSSRGNGNPILHGMSVISVFNFASSSLLGKLINKISVLALTKKISKEYDCVIVYIPSTFSCDIIESVKYKKLIYDCVRDFSVWPGIDDSVIENESAILNKASHLLVDSYYLANKLKIYNPVQLLPVVDEDDICTPKLVEHPISTLAYFGTLSTHVDVLTIKKLLDDGFTIKFWGLNELSFEYDKFVDMGYVSRQKDLLRSIRTECDAIIIPYKGYMDGVIPDKLIQSLALSIPVFCSSFYDSKRLDECLHVYDSYVQLIEMLKSTSNDIYHEKIKIGHQLAVNNTSEAFAKKIVEILDE